MTKAEKVICLIGIVLILIMVGMFLEDILMKISEGPGIGKILDYSQRTWVIQRVRSQQIGDNKMIELSIFDQSSTKAIIVIYESNPYFSDYLRAETKDCVTFYPTVKKIPGQAGDIYFNYLAPNKGSL